MTTRTASDRLRALGVDPMLIAEHEQECKLAIVNEYDDKIERIMDLARLLLPFQVSGTTKLARNRSTTPQRRINGSPEAL